MYMCCSHPKIMNLRMNIALSLIILIGLLWSVQGKSSSHELVVAKDGSGNFTTIAKAIEAAPNNSEVGYTIYIKEGIFAEYILMDEWKTNLILIGKGIDRTVITRNRSPKGGHKTYYTAKFGVRGKKFDAQGITFENVAGPDMDQAVALMSEAEKVTFFRCRFIGYQDTYAKRGIQFLRECEIAGIVDFIFGNAEVVFRNCLIIARKNLPGKPNKITAQGRDMRKEQQGWSYTTAQQIRQMICPKKQTHFGRPWKLFARTVTMQSDIGDLINPQGWSEWDNSSSTKNVYYAEYHGLGYNTSGRVSSARVLDNSHDAEFTVRKFIHGDTWIPKRIPIFSTYYKHLHLSSQEP